MVILFIDAGTNAGFQLEAVPQSVLVPPEQITAHGVKEAVTGVLDVVVQPEPDEKAST